MSETLAWAEHLMGMPIPRHLQALFYKSLSTKKQPVGSGNRRQRGLAAQQRGELRRPNSGRSITFIVDDPVFIPAEVLNV